MRPVYNGYIEKILTGKDLRIMFEGCFFCAGRHHTTVYDLTIDEYFDSLSIQNELIYRIFYNEYFCKIMISDTDEDVGFISFVSLQKSILSNRYLNRSKPICPLCGKETILKEGKFGPFWSCKDFPNCKGSSKIMILGHHDMSGFDPLTMFKQ